MLTDLQMQAAAAADGRFHDIILSRVDPLMHSGYYCMRNVWRFVYGSVMRGKYYKLLTLIYYVADR